MTGSCSPGEVFTRIAFLGTVAFQLSMALLSCTPKYGCPSDTEVVTVAVDDVDVDVAVLALLRFGL